MLPRAFCLCLALLLCSIGVTAASTQQASDILREIDDAVNVTHKNYEFDIYPKFNNAIAKAYSVAKVDALKDSVSVALVFRLPKSRKFVAFVYPAEQPSQPGASSLKIALAMRAAKEVADGEATWQTPIGSSTLIDTVRTMIANSNNGSANKLLDRYGVVRINAWLKKLGFHPGEMHFGRHFGDFSPAAKADDNTCTALGLAMFYALLATDETLTGFGDTAAIRKVRNLLTSTGDCNSNPKFNDRLNALLPEVPFAHKTGSNADVMVDGGIVQGYTYNYILVVIDKTKNRSAMQRLGKAMYELVR